MSFINYELYRIFYMVASTGSITKAAGELYISQPAVSQSIKQLETQIGGRLFKRTSKGMELTYEGKMIYDYIKEANQLILVTTNPLKKCQYLYIFPDYNVSKTKYLKKISEFYILGGTEQEDKFYYVDMKGTAWLYTKKGPKKVSKEIFY